VEDPTYAEYLLAAFETAWPQAIPAQERIEELEKREKAALNVTCL